METVDSRKRAVYWIHTFVYFLLTFCFGYLPFHALTPFGMNIVGIFIGLLYGWTFIGFVWPSMMSIFALGLCGYFKTPQAAFASAFSNPSRMWERASALFRSKIARRSTTSSRWSM